MKKSTKIMLAIVGILLIGGLLVVGNAFVGNPISQRLATDTAESYINQHYASTDYSVEKVNYNFKDGGYYARIKSPSSVDTRFTLAISSRGKLIWDSYEDRVTNGHNTWDRLDNEYRKMVRAVFEAEDFPYVSHIAGGSIREMYSAAQGSCDKDFGLDPEKLVLDKAYDVRELGSRYGEITFYAQDETVSVKRASEILLDITRRLNEQNVPFYAITFVLQKPRNQDTPNADKREIHLIDFLYRDIYEGGLEERVRKSHTETMAYFAEQDAQKGAIASPAGR